MNLNDPRHPWRRLVTAARQAQDQTPAAPYGFATRVAARALASERRLAGVFDRFALRALGIACLLAAASIAINYSMVANSTHGAMADDELQMTPTEDPVAVLLDA